MLNLMWTITIIFLSYLGLSIAKQIHFNNLKFKKMSKKIDKDGLFMSLGTKIGVGSIIGTASSILIGGAGSLFWIWIFTIIFSSIIYAESYLGNKYKDKKNNISGPYFYIKKSLNKNKLSIIITILLILTYSHFFLMIQTNTITEIMHNNIYIIIISILFLLTTIILNTKEILKILNKIVPIMCLIYILIGIFIIINNTAIILDITKTIIIEAFSYKGITVGLIVGIKRSIFQSELLVGTTAVASGISNEKSESVAYTQILGMYFISFIICTLTAYIILIYNNYNLNTFNSYNELLLNVFNYHLGEYGELILIIEIILFSITTILSGFYMGTSIIKYFTENKTINNIIKITMLTSSIIGLLIQNNIIWLLIDSILFIIIVLNGYAINKLKGEVNDRQWLGWKTKSSMGKSRI